MWTGFLDKREAGQKNKEHGVWSEEGGGPPPHPGAPVTASVKSGGPPQGGSRGVFEPQNRSHTPDDPQRGSADIFFDGGGQPASKSTTHTRKTQGTRTSCCVVIKGWSRLSSWHRNWPLTGVLVAAWRKRWLQHGACAQNIAPELRFGLQIGTRITFRHPDMFRNCVLTPKHSMGRTRGTVKRGTVISRN